MCLISEGRNVQLQGCGVSGKWAHLAEWCPLYQRPFHVPDSNILGEMKILPAVFLESLHPGSVLKGYIFTNRLSSRAHFLHSSCEKEAWPGEPLACI